MNFWCFLVTPEKNHPVYYSEGASPKKSGPGAQIQTFSRPFFTLWSGSGPSPEFRTLLVPLHILYYAPARGDFAPKLLD